VTQLRRVGGLPRSQADAVEGVRVLEQPEAAEGAPALPGAYSTKDHAANHLHHVCGPEPFLSDTDATQTRVHEIRGRCTLTAGCSLCSR